MNRDRRAICPGPTGDFVQVVGKMIGCKSGLSMNDRVLVSRNRNAGEDANNKDRNDDFDGAERSSGLALFHWNLLESSSFTSNTLSLDVIGT